MEQPEKRDDRTEQLRAFDQAAAFVTESLPPMWRRLYLNSIAEGFSQDQAMKILQTYISASIGKKDD